MTGRGHIRCQFCVVRCELCVHADFCAQRMTEDSQRARQGGSDDHLKVSGDKACFHILMC